MGDFCGFVARVSNADANEVARRIADQGGRDLKVYPELGLVLGLLKSYAPCDNSTKLELTEGVDEFHLINV